MIRIVKKFRSIMNREQQMRILLLGVLMVIGAMLEMAGVSLVLPLMTAVTDKKNPICSFCAGRSISRRTMRQ